jgi:molybdenum cofactor guanylyltransferase
VNGVRGPRTTAAILAGGAARRLGGVDKGLALWRGWPLIVHVTDALAGQADDIVILANRHADAYARHAPVLPDEHAGFRGPLEGIATALRHCRGEWLLTVPVDSPRPGADLLARLRSGIGDAAIAVAHDGARRQPLFALYAVQRVALPDLDAEPQLAVWAWQDRHAVSEVDFSASAARFANLNTPEDFADDCR